MPQNSYLITLNEHAAAAETTLIMSLLFLENFHFQKQSIVDTQAIAMIF